MSVTTLLSIAFLLIAVLFIMLLAAVTKINSLHRRLADVDPNELYPLVEELREMVIESERVADKLGDSINKKEEVLEDLIALADEKLKRLESIDIPETPQQRPQQTIPMEDPIEDNVLRETLPKPKMKKPDSGGAMRGAIAQLIEEGRSDAEIASELGISTTEVQIVKQLGLR